MSKDITGDGFLGSFHGMKPTKHNHYLQNAVMGLVAAISAIGILILLLSALNISIGTTILEKLIAG